jgi:hypothetical protein
MEIEPYPIENGELWEEGSPQWLARYEYIEARAETYLDYYRDSPEYDFTRGGVQVGSAQRAIASAYSRFAAGTLEILGVQALVKMLRDAYKRKEATVVTPEERAAAIEAAKPVPKWRQDWETKKGTSSKAPR